MRPHQSRFAAFLILFGLAVLSFLRFQRPGRILLGEIVGSDGAIVAKDRRTAGVGARVVAEDRRNREGTAPVSVCVRERPIAKPTQSIWAALNRFGSGRYRFVVPALEGKCDTGWPLVRSLRGRIRSNKISNDTVVLTFHMGDEWCRKRDWTEQYGGIRPDFAFYWDGRNPIATWNSTSFLNGGDDSGGVAFLPLGPQFTFRPVDEGEVVLPSERRYLFNFMGTLATSRTRHRLAEILADIEYRKKKRGGSGRTDGASREEGGNDKERMSFDEPTVPDVFLEKESLIVIPKLWQSMKGREKRVAESNEEDREAGEAKEEYLSAENYRAALLQSTFTLCPSGHNPESYRIFEAAEAGSIPVLALDKHYRNHSCHDAFLPFIESGAPFVFVNDWSELSVTLAELFVEPEKLAERQAELRRWYREFMGGVSAAVEQVVDARLRDRPVDLSRLRSTPGSLSGLATPGRARSPLELDVEHPPVVVVGMHDVGTSTIRDYFRCGGAKTSHHYCGQNDSLPVCGKVIKTNIVNGRPPLSGKHMQWDVFAQIHSHKTCYYPQMESLFEIHKQYPNSTFLLNLQNMTQWASSLKNGYSKQLVKCDLPGLPAGVRSKGKELVSWFEMHVNRVRRFVSQYPSHKLVEVSIDSKEAGWTMEENFGISIDCWNHSEREQGDAGRRAKHIGKPQVQSL